LLEKSNAFWIITKFKLKIQDFPRFEETISMETWPTTVDRIRFRRDFLIERMGESIVMGTSEWCTLDYDTKAIRKASSICYPFDMVHRDKESGAGEFFKIKEQVLPTEYHHTHVSSFVDIDTNQHTNNVAYLKMALNTFSPEEFQAIQPAEVQVSFLSQTYFGDSIEVFKKETEYGFYIEGKHREKPVFNCIIIVQK